MRRFGRSFVFAAFVALVILFTPARLNSSSRPRHVTRSAPATPKIVRRGARRKSKPRSVTAYLGHLEFCGDCLADTSKRPLAVQNRIATERKFLRLRTNDEIDRYFQKGDLVRIPDRGDSFYLDPHMKAEFRYASPVVLSYIEELARA